MAAATSKAQQEAKIIFIDFYASWCGPCVQMQRTVFPQPKVAQFFNINFVNLKIDVDKHEPDFVASMNIQSIPALVFMNSRGEVIFRATGYHSAEEFIDLGEQVLGYFKRSSEEVGKLAGKELQHYLEVHQVNNYEESAAIALKALEAYASSDYKDEQAWFLMKNFVRDIHHPAFQVFVKNANWFYNAYADAFSFWNDVRQAEMDKIVQSKSVEQLDTLAWVEATLEEILNLKEFGNDYYQQKNMIIYSRGIGDMENYYNSLENWVVHYYNNNHKELLQQAVNLLEVGGSSDFRLALKFASRAYSLSKEARVVGVHGIATGKAGADPAEGEKLLKNAMKNRKYTKDEVALFKEALYYLQ